MAGDSPQWRLRLLGGFRLEADGRAQSVPASSRRIVAFLGIRGWCDRTELVGALWPDAPEPKARAALRTALWRLHRTLGRALVAGGEAVAIAGTAEVDVQALTAMAERIRSAGAGPPDPPPRPGQLAAGELLPGWYEDWVLFERERLRQLQLHALEALAGQLTGAARFAEAIEAALAAVGLEPLRESAVRALIVAHLGEHNLVEAVRCFEAFRCRLAAELGVRPSPGLERLVRHGGHLPG